MKIILAVFLCFFVTPFSYAGESAPSKNACEESKVINFVDDFDLLFDDGGNNSSSKGEGGNKVGGRQVTNEIRVTGGYIYFIISSYNDYLNVDVGYDASKKDWFHLLKYFDFILCEDDRNVLVKMVWNGKLPDLEDRGNSIGRGASYVFDKETMSIKYKILYR